MDTKKDEMMRNITRMEPGERMSRIVIHNNVVYLCGQVADNGSDPIGPQTQSMLNKVDALLEKAGSSREHMLSATIYLRDMKDFSDMNVVWDTWVPEGCAPSRACVEARLARTDLLVEISVIAALKE